MTVKNADEIKRAIERESEQTAAALSRRDLLLRAAGTGLTFGTGFAGFADFLEAQANDDEHFFIFIELRGGLHWMIATDGRDISQLPIDDPSQVFTLKLSDEPLPEETITKLVNHSAENEKFILLPYLEDLASSYSKGQTSLGANYVLGFAADALKLHVDDLAVIRGVHMQGTFHGPNNASGEIFSGIKTTDSPHVAGVMAHYLDAKYGVCLLDNLVFENATFNTGKSAFVKPPVRLDAQSLGYLVGNTADDSSLTPEVRFAKARLLADALSRRQNLSDLHRKVFQSYVGAMGQAPKVREMLLALRNDLGSVDASLDLSLQLKTATTLMQAGLTRVATLCLGAPNGKNQVDSFGLFDCHVGLYYIDPNRPDLANTVRHQKNVTATMEKLAAFIKTLKTTKFRSTNKTMFDVTTVIVGTEFARPSNLQGNEGQGAFGNGHYWYNNNYLLFGKGVKGGSWLGKNDVIRQMGEQVDLASLEQQNPSAVTSNPVRFTFQPDDPGGVEGTDPGYYKMDEIDYNSNSKRPLMARDVVRTIMTIGGQGDKFTEAYTDPDIANAKSIKPVVAS